MDNQASTLSDAGPNYELTELEMARVSGGDSVEEMVQAVLSSCAKDNAAAIVDFVSNMNRRHGQVAQFSQTLTEVKRARSDRS
jgi:hypothetical protein